MVSSRHWEGCLFQLKQTTSHMQQNEETEHRIHGGATGTCQVWLHAELQHWSSPCQQQAIHQWDSSPKRRSVMRSHAAVTVDLPEDPTTWQYCLVHLSTIWFHLQKCQYMMHHLCALGIGALVSGCEGPTLQCCHLNSSWSTPVKNKFTQFHHYDSTSVSITDWTALV